MALTDLFAVLKKKNLQEKYFEEHVLLKVFAHVSRLEIVSARIMATCLFNMLRMSCMESFPLITI